MKMIRGSCLLGLTILLPIVSLGNAPELPFVNVDVSVVDLDNNPISNALVRVTFSDWEQNEYKEEATSDVNGTVSFHRQTSLELFFRVTHKDYYSNAVRHILDGDIIDDKIVYTTNRIHKLFRLKKIKNPVPMYVKFVDRKIPDNGAPVGFDFLVGDFVKPYGKGKVGDITLATSGYINSYKDYSSRLEIKFPREGDGLIELDIPRTDHMEKNELRLDYEAPKEGYVGYYEISSSKPGKNKWPKQSANYYFRIRTKKDEDGKIVSAMYGKIHEPINYAFSKKEKSVRFYYYLNPDGTRNVECDPSTNLFKNGRTGFNP